MKFYSYFEDIESKNSDEINKKFSTEISYFLLLLEVLDSYLNKVNGKIRNDQFPEHTILNFSAQNLQLINNAFILFTQGYLRSPSILLRTVSEQLILSMFFKEFPNKEQEYKNTSYRDFFKENRIEKMLSKIDREGKIFKVKKFTKYNYWNKTIYKNFFEELSYFVHSNPNVINNLMYDETNGKYHKGPKLQDKDILKALLRKLFESTLYTILILDKTFEPNQTKEEIERIIKATKIINTNLKLQDKNG